MKPVPQQSNTQAGGEDLASFLSAEAWAKREFLSRPVRGVPEIALDQTPVPPAQNWPHATWWRGRQWSVTAYGIERLDGGYMIAANRLRENIEQHAWPQHMAGKRWVDVDEFATAWVIALTLYGHAAKVAPEQLFNVFAKLPPWPECAPSTSVQEPHQ